jgi:hypothetical protein
MAYQGLMALARLNGISRLGYAFVLCFSLCFWLLFWAGDFALFFWLEFLAYVFGHSFWTLLSNFAWL